MKQSTARYCTAIGVFSIVLSIIGIPLWVEWWHRQTASTEVSADYLGGLAVIFSQAGDKPRAHRLQWESQRIRNNWITEIVKCRSQDEVQLLLQPLAEEGVGRGQKQVERSDGSWELHLVVQDRKTLAYALQRIAEIREGHRSRLAEQAAPEQPLPAAQFR